MKGGAIPTNIRILFQNGEFCVKKGEFSLISLEWILKNIYIRD